MRTYVDSSALLKRYVAEADSGRVDELLAEDPELFTGRHTLVEVRRNLARLLPGTAIVAARADFARDLESISIVELDAGTCELAATIAEQLGVRSLDALCLGQPAGSAHPFVASSPSMSAGRRGEVAGARRRRCSRMNHSRPSRVPNAYLTRAARRSPKPRRPAHTAGGATR